MISQLKDMINKWFHDFNENIILLEVLVIFIMSITVVPKFFEIALCDYDNYTSKYSFYVTSVFNEGKFKNEMLQNDTIEYRERLLKITNNFSKLLFCKSDEEAQTIQNYLETSLTGDIGVLLIDKSNDRWFSNRNWFSDYPYSELTPKEALLKLSKEDDVIVFSSNNLTHYSAPSGYSNGAYTSPNSQLEEIYFIRGDKYKTIASLTRTRFYSALPLLTIFCILIAKQFYCIKSSSINEYLRYFNRTLIIRALKSVAMFFKNLKEIFRSLFLDTTILALTVFWIVYLPLTWVFNFYTEFSIGNYDLTPIFVLLTIMSIFVNIVVRYLENINNIKNLVGYLRKIENGDIDVDINSKTLGTLSNLGDGINNLKVIYKKKVEEGLRNERLKTELITNVSHDLKTPLTSIVSYVDILKDENLDKDEIKDYVAILDNKSTRLKKLVEDLFEMSKMSSNQIMLDKAKIDIVELIHQNLGELTFLGEEKHLTFKVGGESYFIITVDGDKISRVMDNLICNAIKYSLENSRIYIDVSSIDNYCEITIKNVSKYDLDFNEEEVLERFVRGDKSRHSSVEGSGLGLAISKAIIDLHEGTFKVKCDGDLFKVIIRLPI